MPTLNWVGKDKIINHHHEVPFRVLQHQTRFDAPAGSPSNSTDRLDQASDQAGKLLQFCATSRSVSEMMQHLGLNHRTYFRKTVLQPLITSGKLTPTIPDKPSSPNQRYIAVKPEVN